MAAGSLLCAVLLALGTGLAQRFQSSPEGGSEPWQQALAPLAQAPLAAGTRVALMPPPDTGRMARGLLYEAEWRRPDLLWGLVSEWPPEVPLTRMVTTQAWQVPAGWRVVWRSGGLVLAEEGR